MPKYEYVASPNIEGYLPYRWSESYDNGNGHDGAAEGVSGLYLVSNVSSSAFSNRPNIDEVDFNVTFQFILETEAGYSFRQFAWTRSENFFVDGRHTQIAYGIEQSYAELPGMEPGEGPYLGESPVTHSTTFQDEQWQTTNSQDSQLLPRATTITLSSYNVISVETKVATITVSTEVSAFVPSNTFNSDQMPITTLALSQIASWTTQTGGLVTELSTEPTVYTDVIQNSQYVQTAWVDFAGTTPIVANSADSPASSLVRTAAVSQTTAETFWKTLPIIGSNPGEIAPGGILSFSTEASGEFANSVAQSFSYTKSTTGKYTSYGQNGPAVMGAHGRYITSATSSFTVPSSTSSEQSLSDSALTTFDDYLKKTTNVPFLMGGVVLHYTERETNNTWNADAYSSSLVVQGSPISRTEIKETPLAFKHMKVIAINDPLLHHEGRKINLAMKNGGETGGGAGYGGGTVVAKQQFSSVTIEGLQPVTNYVDGETVYSFSATRYTSFDSDGSGTGTISTTGQSTSYYSTYAAAAPYTVGLPKVNSVYWAGGHWDGQIVVPPGLYSTQAFVVEDAGGTTTSLSHTGETILYDTGSQVMWEQNNTNITAFVQFPRFISIQDVTPGPIESVTAWTAQPIDD